MLRVVAIALLAPAVAAAQSLHTTHTYSGLDATSARTRIERDGPRPYGPKSEAAAMTAAAGPVIRVVKPAFRLPERDLGIADTYEVLFFGETRLVRLRVHLMAAGEPLSKRWTGQLRQYFEFLDRDGDGTLNRHEAEFAFTNAGVAQMLQSGFAYQRPDDAARMFADLDRDGDGRVSFDEFAAFYSQSAGRVISAQQNPARDVYADGLTDELFKLIDTDKDGKLSRAELRAVEKVFATLDADEDECLSAMEVAPNVFNGRKATRPVPIGANTPTPMMVFQPGALPDSIIETILKRYDKDGNLVLSKAENPFGDEGFKLFDKNGNGEISVTELLAWKDAPPDLELDMTLGAKADESAIGVRPRADGKPAPLAAAFKAAGDGTAVLTVAHQAIQLSCYTARGVYADMGGRQSAIQFSPTRTGYITEKDIVGPQFQSLRVLFDLIDRDADGRMSRAEFDAFVNLQQSFTRLPLSLVYSARRPACSRSWTKTATAG